MGNEKLIQYRDGRALAVQMNPNFMKQMNDILEHSENSNKLTESLFVITEKLWKLGDRSQAIILKFLKWKLISVNTTLIPFSI